MPATRLARLACLALALGAAAPRALAAEEQAPAPRHEDARMLPVPWTLPPPGSCQAPRAPATGAAPDAEAGAPPFQPGDVFGFDRIELLRAYLPPFLWEHRERFFYEGMRLEIGRCFADYGPPEFYREASAQHAGEPKLEDDGGLAGYAAGQPFLPERIAPDDPLAGLRWAWNVEMRYAGAGFAGRFRTSDMVGRDGRAEPFVGEIFKHQVAFRADRPGYEVAGADEKHWVSGGSLEAPFDARHHAWRQFRDVEHLVDADRSDDLHAYLPDHRRVRRLPAVGIEGLYMPSFSVGVVKPQILSGLSGGGEGGTGGGALGGATAGAITTKRSGFEGLELRPLLYTWKVQGVQDLLTPIAATTPAFPAQENRDFGPWGLSFASDRWDLRRALVLEAHAKGEAGGDAVARMLLYVDLQTLVPLYYASWDARGEALDVGMFVGRWSEDRPDYPRWPDDPARPIRVVDSAGASFAHLGQGGGWRRESWEIVSTPPPDSELPKLLSLRQLTKKR